MYSGTSQGRLLNIEAFKTGSLSKVACLGMSMKVIVMTEYILRGDNQVEPDSEIIRDILFAWISAGDGLWTPKNLFCVLKSDSGLVIGD